MLKMAVFAPMPRASVIIATAENAGFLITCRKAKRRLLITKCDHRIDARGTTRRNETGSGRDRGQQRGHRKINCWIEGVDFEENIFQRRRRNDTEQQRDPPSSDNKADAELPRALRHDHSEDSRCVRAQCHADSKFLRALIDRETHHAVKPDRRQNECDDSEYRKQRRDDVITRENFIVKSTRSSGKISRKVRIQLVNLSAQSGAKSVSLLACPRTSKDRAKLRSGRCAQQRHVKTHALGLLIERTLHQGVRHNADIGSPRLRLTGIEGSHLVTNRALVPPIFS